jgi:hypothetical protein
VFCKALVTVTNCPAAQQYHELRCNARRRIDDSESNFPGGDLDMLGHFKLGWIVSKSPKADTDELDFRTGTLFT